ncbi:hypothetical protein PPACK8108_LOCUS11383 [Phakopsora pachyrhizi]|uniref:Uncharacterized protein n=1 Tax=Phakopsora pachyrhizi TaxID=170000 RepID=A0AAV0B241_PHAPC|nr:hypothetical protein PPACK8108_LOCUS11383 [Phakopsora pachyrhizi]
MVHRVLKDKLTAKIGDLHAAEYAKTEVVETDKLGILRSGLVQMKGGSWFGQPQSEPEREPETSNKGVVELVGFRGVEDHWKTAGQGSGKARTLEIHQLISQIQEDQLQPFDYQTTKELKSMKERKPTFEFVLDDYASATDVVPWTICEDNKKWRNERTNGKREKCGDQKEDKTRRRRKDGSTTARPQGTPPEADISLVALRTSAVKSSRQYVFWRRRQPS